MRRGGILQRGNRELFHFRGPHLPLQGHFFPTPLDHQVQRGVWCPGNTSSQDVLGSLHIEIFPVYLLQDIARLKSHFAHGAVQRNIVPDNDAFLVRGRIDKGHPVLEKEEAVHFSPLKAQAHFFEKLVVIDRSSPADIRIEEIPDLGIGVFHDDIKKGFILKRGIPVVFPDQFFHQVQHPHFTPTELPQPNVERHIDKGPLLVDIGILVRIRFFQDIAAHYRERHCIVIGP